MTPEMQRIETRWQAVLEIACLVLLIFGIVSVIALAKAAGPAGTGTAVGAPASAGIGAPPAPAGSLPAGNAPVGPGVNRTLPNMDTLGNSQSGTTILPSSNQPGGLAPSYPGPFGAPGSGFMTSTPTPGGNTLTPGVLPPGSPPTSPTR